jgi:hypothetical protein
MVDPVILDACCTLNLAATGRAEAILRQLPYRFVVGPRARGETLWLVVPDSDEREPVDLEPLIGAGALREEPLQGPEEEALFVEFSIQLADGEAEAAALSVNRGYTLATDDRKAQRVVREKEATVRLSGTLELLRKWQIIAGSSEAEVGDVLRRIAKRATYRPRRAHPLYEWWKNLVGE